MISKENLDKRICDCEDCNNTETYREFITGAESYLEIEPVNIDIKTDDGLEEYLDFLDYLLSK